MLYSIPENREAKCLSRNAAVTPVSLLLDFVTITSSLSIFRFPTDRVVHAGLLTMKTPSFIFFELLPFLLPDSHFSCSLTCRGLRQIVSEHQQRQLPIVLAWPLPERCAAVWLVRSIWRHFCSLRMTEESPVQLPGMELERAPDYDVVWGTAFPARRHDHVQWAVRHRMLIGGCGRVGTALLGIGACRDQSVICFGVVINSAMSGPQGLCASLLFDSRGRAVDAYWATCLDDSQVHLLPQDGVVTEALVSSDPFCFGNLFVHNSPSSDSNEVHLMKTFSPFRLELPQVVSCTQKVQQLLNLCEAVCDRNDIGNFVKHEFLEAVTRELVALPRTNVCSVKEEIQHLTTPKGIWACATGNGLKTEVDLSQRWSHRSNKLLHQIDKGARRGVFLECVLFGWFPTGILRCVECAS